MNLAVARGPGLPAIRLSAMERKRYVRWWLEESGLSRAELRFIAGGLWTGPVPQLELATPRSRFEAAR